MEKPIIYTVGHSTHELDFFLELIKTVEINCIVDVRSLPASAYSPQYNQNSFKNYLKDNHITYLHFAEEFGARRTDYDLLGDDGKLDFEKVRKTSLFNRGVERIWQGIDKGFRIALMCSESDPLDCHRFSMVSIGLENNGFNVLHLLKDKSIKTNLELEKELLKKYEKKIPQSNLFESEVSFEKQLKEALRLKNKEIGFSPNLIHKEQEMYD
ncbi:MAG: DUF488 domain-containing protein [Bacteroidales bacterium]|jgi:uncharacterized protein (DUF488 family)|nr:DUF488 domain-containing protein [Bacteroidales bacterium]